MLHEFIGWGLVFGWPVLTFLGFATPLYIIVRKLHPKKDK